MNDELVTEKIKILYNRLHGLYCIAGLAIELTALAVVTEITLQQQICPQTYDYRKLQ